MTKPNPTLEIYKYPSGRFMWRLIGFDGEKMARGSQARGFTTVAQCWRNVLTTCVYLSGDVSGLLPVRAPNKNTAVEVVGHKVSLSIRRVG